MPVIPSCADLPAAFELDRHYPRAAFEARLEPEGRDDANWVTVGRCRECGQLWRVDVWDKYRVCLAMKAAATAPWTAAQDRAARIEYLRRARGGEGDEPCMWAECPNRALKGLAYCAEHAYDRTGARS